MTTYPDPLPIPPAHGPVRGRVRLPGSKSFTNRALPIAALASGTSTIRGVLDSDDTRYMTQALEQLGFQIAADWPGRTIQITGAGGTIPASQAALFLGNSGTSMRFLAAFCALGRGTYRLDGVERMRERPIEPLTDGLRQLGTEISFEGRPGYPPVTIQASGLSRGPVSIAGHLSSQYFSALAMVAPYADEPIEIRVEGNLVSKPYLDVTAAAMRAFDVELIKDDFRSFTTPPGQRYQTTDYTVEPDASSASYFFALAAVTGGELTVADLSPDSPQGDVRFVEILEQMGCRVEKGSEITVHGPGQLRGVDVDMHDISDTVMTLAAIAPFADGPTRIRNVANIRVKETDRLRAMATELTRLGIEVEELDDGLIIQPGQIKPATVQTYDDHRMAMALAITGAASGSISIADPGCVSKTVPEFWELLFPLLGAGAPVI